MSELWHLLRNPNNLVHFIIDHGGLYMLLFIIFAETGLFAGFFLPGDSLLFVAGIYATKLGESFFNAHYLIVMLAVAIAAIIGNVVGYWFGYKSGPFLYSRKDTMFFKKKYLLAARDFFEKQGSMAIILGRFLPFVRTFAPIVAGIVKMPFQKFLRDSIVGGFAWVFSMMLLGKFIHQIVLKKYNYDLTNSIEVIALGIILVTTAPVIYKFIKQARQQKSQ